VRPEKVGGGYEAAERRGDAAQEGIPGGGVDGLEEGILN
jgi:hypothetical protein